MTKSRLLFFAISSLLVLTVVGGSLMAAVGQDDDGEDSFYKYLSVFTEVLGLVRQAYVEEISLDVLMAGALDGTTEALDPFSVYLPESQAEPYMEARDRGRRMSGLTLLKDRGIAFAAAVEPGSPAAEAGIQVSDIITDLNGQATRLMPVWELQKTLAADTGTPVEVKLLRRGERETAAFQLGAFAPPKAGLRMTEGVPLLEVGGLQDGSTAGIRAALERLARENRPDLLVDLRGVAGGDPAAAYQVAGLFTRGDLGRLSRRGEAIRTFRSSNDPLWTGRILVLIDRGTLGAAEVLARVLQQKADAELVGESTFGYAGHQEISDLPSGGRLIYTDSFYTGPDAEPIDEGLEPDVRVTNRDRRLADRDLPVGELILQRALRRLAEDADSDEAALPEAA